MEEVWKVYHNNKKLKLKYEISNFGNVKRNDKIYECRISKGYKCFYCKFLHRAVAELFIPNPENKSQVDHIDGNKLNNRVDNLRWATPRENSNNPITKSFLKQGVNKHINSINYINPMQNKHHTKESKEKNRISHLGLQVGEKNGMYGKNHTKESNEKNILSHLNRHRIYYIDNDGNKKYKMSK